VGLLVASDRYETRKAPESCPLDRGLRQRQEHPACEFSVGYLSLPRAPNRSSWATAMADAFRVPSPPLAPPYALSRRQGQQDPGTSYALNITSVLFSLYTASKIAHCTEVSIDFAKGLTFYYICVKIGVEKALVGGINEHWDARHADTEPEGHQPAAVEPTLWHCRLVPLKD